MSLRKGPATQFGSCHRRFRCSEFRGPHGLPLLSAWGLGMSQPLLSSGEGSGDTDGYSTSNPSASPRSPPPPLRATFSFCVAGTFCTCRLKEMFSMVDCSAPSQMLPTWVPVLFKVSDSGCPPPPLHWTFRASHSPICALPAHVHGVSPGRAGHSATEPWLPSLPSLWGPGGKLGCGGHRDLCKCKGDSRTHVRAQSLCFKGDRIYDFMKSSERTWGVLCSEFLLHTCTPTRTRTVWEVSSHVV